MSLSIGACSKQTAPEFDVAGPDVVFVQPQHNQVFNPGDEVSLVIDISENLGLHTYHIILVNGTTNIPLSLIAKNHIHGTNVRVDTSFVLPKESGQTFLIDVEAIDHDDNVTKTALPIKTR